MKPAIDESTRMSAEQYRGALDRYSESSDSFWADIATRHISWSVPFSTVHGGYFGRDRWFEDGLLNACYNCIDRWVESQPDKTAVIFNDNGGHSRHYTYRESLHEILRICQVIKHLKTGDCVTMYLAMSPRALFTALACARLGITHNFVFGGFSADALRLRIRDSRSVMLISQDFGQRGDKRIEFLPVIKEAVDGLDVELLIFDDDPMTRELYCRGGGSSSLDKWVFWSALDPVAEPIGCVAVPATHPLFYLYTSGSTGHPKGLIHSTGGYLTYVSYTLQIAFDITSDAIFCCTADVGWITGHSYCLYGPLSLGITTVILEGLPTFPDHYRLFNIIEKYKITHLYTAPTIIRILKAHFDIRPLDSSRHDIGSIRLLGTVGEPINTEAYRWFSESFGHSHVVDTYFQTETGGIIVAPLPCMSGGKPECAAYPLPGILPVLLSHGKTGARAPVPPNELGMVFIKEPWPGIAMGVLNGDEKFHENYFGRDPYYCTGDEGIVDSEGLLWIKGRADDVINVSGHRISTAEVESAACSNPAVSEAAIVPFSHKIKGSAMVLFVVLKTTASEYSDYSASVKATIRRHLGSFCNPEKVIACKGIPKTATGKLLRRVLRRILYGEEIGDLSTCVNSEVIPSIVEDIKQSGLFNDSLG